MLINKYCDSVAITIICLYLYVQTMKGKFLSYWASSYENHIGWFRLFGRGLKWKRIDKHPKLFSERYGYTKYIMIGRWLIGYLPNR